MLPKKIVVEGFAKSLSVVFEENLQTLKKQKDLFVVFQEWSAGLQGRDGHPAEAHLEALLPASPLPGYVSQSNQFIARLKLFLQFLYCISIQQMNLSFFETILNSLNYSMNFKTRKNMTE